MSKEDMMELRGSVTEALANAMFRAKTLTERAERDLGKRAEAEAREMAAILEAQRERIWKRQRQLVHARCRSSW